MTHLSIKFINALDCGVTLAYDGDDDDDVTMILLRLFTATVAGDAGCCKALISAGSKPRHAAVSGNARARIFS